MPPPLHPLSLLSQLTSSQLPLIQHVYTHLHPLPTDELFQALKKHLYATSHKIPTLYLIDLLLKKQKKHQAALLLELERWTQDAYCTLRTKEERKKVVNTTESWRKEGWWSCEREWFIKEDALRPIQDEKTDKEKEREKEKDRDKDKDKEKVEERSKDKPKASTPQPDSTPRSQSNASSSVHEFMRTANLRQLLLFDVTVLMTESQKSLQQGDLSAQQHLSSLPQVSQLTPSYFWLR
jgi:hypothetical protein